MFIMLYLWAFIVFRWNDFEICTFHGTELYFLGPLSLYVCSVHGMYICT